MLFPLVREFLEVSLLARSLCFTEYDAQVQISFCLALCFGGSGSEVNRVEEDAIADLERRKRNWYADEHVLAHVSVDSGSVEEQVAI